jgi:hypothetical protein
MKNRKPICLFGALAIAAAWLFVILYSFFATPSYQIDHYDAETDLVIESSIICGSILLGLLFSILSIWRKERFRWAALACFVVFLQPIIWAIEIASEL